MNRNFFTWLVVFVLVGFLVSAVDMSVILDKGESVVIKDKNVSLVDSLNDKILICVNGEKKIIEEGLSKRVNDVLIEVKKANFEEVSLKLSYRCGNCLCDDCSNEVCFAECKSDVDCDDKDGNSIDVCEEKKCVHKISNEKGGFVVLEKECLIDSECSDGNVSTKDFCFNEKCFHGVGEEISERTKYSFFALIFVLILIIILMVVYFKTRKRRHHHFRKYN